MTGNRIAAIGPARNGRDAGRAPGCSMRAARRSFPGSSIRTRTCTTPASRSFPETKWEYIANLAYGVTTVYDPSAPSLDVFAQAEMVEAGVMTRPARLFIGRRALRRSAGADLRRGQQPRRCPPAGEADEGVRRADDQGLSAAAPRPAHLVRRGRARAEDAGHGRRRRRAASPI